jgi:hypothetical protein
VAWNTNRLDKEYMSSMIIKVKANVFILELLKGIRNTIKCSKPRIR